MWQLNRKDLSAVDGGSQEGPLRRGCSQFQHLLSLRNKSKFTGGGGMREASLKRSNQISRYFVQIDHRGKRSANHLWDREREFGGPVIGLVIGKQEDPLWILHTSCGDGDSLQWAVSQNTKVRKDFLIVAVFQEHRAQLRFNTVCS